MDRQVYECYLILKIFSYHIKKWPDVRKTQLCVYVSLSFSMSFSWVLLVLLREWLNDANKMQKRTFSENTKKFINELILRKAKHLDFTLAKFLISKQRRFDMEKARKPGLIVTSHHTVWVYWCVCITLSLYIYKCV